MKGIRDLSGKGIMTRALHAGWRSDPTTGAFCLPTYITAGYEFADTEAAADIFALDRPGYIYSRLGNPTVDAFEQALASIDGGVAAVAASSGQAAFTMLVMALASPGDRIVLSRSSYGGTLTLLKNLFARFGVDVVTVDINDAAAVKGAMNERTRALICEAVGNPTMNVAPIEELAEIAHSHGAPLAVDNTFTPVACRPIDLGADVVVYSTTKYISGLGSVIGGAVVDSGRFDWRGGRWPAFTEPDPSYHGIVLTDKFGSAALAARLRISIMRDIGVSASPTECWLLRQTLTTLPLRMARHSDNALAAAKFLEAHAKVASVSYPGLDSHPQRALARRYMPNGCGGMMSFELKGGYDAGVRFLNALEMFANVANVGDSRSMAIHSASTTHAQLSAAERAACGIGEGMIRLSIGIEDIDDIIADLSHALDNA